MRRSALLTPHCPQTAVESAGALRATVAAIESKKDFMVGQESVDYSCRAGSYMEAESNGDDRGGMITMREYTAERPRKLPVDDWHVHLQVAP